MNVTSRLLAVAAASLLATAAVAQYAPPPPPPPPPPTAQGAMPPPPPPPPAAPVAPTAPAEQQALPAPAPPAYPPGDRTSAGQTTTAPVATGGMTNERSVQFQNQQGATVTVNYGMPAPTDYGPKPPFAQLDSNGDGRIDQSEAQAYLLLANDWIHVAHHAGSISRAQYDAWNE